MTMCVQQFNYFQFIRLNKLEQLFFFCREIAARIYDDCLFIFIVEHIRIFLNGTKCKNLNLYHTPILPAFNGK